MHLLRATTLVLVLYLPVAHADPYQLAQGPYQGRIDYVLVGASFSENGDGQASSGVRCLLEQASVTIENSRIPQSARLVAATLYLSGSLIADDGPDYLSPNIEIFSTPNLRADLSNDVVAIETRARAAADRTIFFNPASSPQVTELSAIRSTYVTVFYKENLPEAGNVAFFMTPIDVTDIIKNQGNSQMTGTFTVSGLQADICRGQEALCSASPPLNACQTVSNDHTHGAASFALLIVYEEASLPQHTVTVFEGLETFAGSHKDFVLSQGIDVSTPASGSLSFYALEGDLSAGLVNNETACKADEYIAVDGGAAAAPLCLTDDDNPIGNLFNTTINEKPAVNSPACSSVPSELCCLGDGRCGVTGVDIDRFDISKALKPGAKSITIDIGTDSDRIALGILVVGVNVFSPILHINSQLRVLNSNRGLVQLGDSWTYSLALSNTGNISATNVQTDITIPNTITSFEVMATPELSIVSKKSGVGGETIKLSNVTVAVGKVQELRLKMNGPCTLSGQSIKVLATISGDSISSFQTERIVRISGPGIGPCTGVDPEGDFLPADPNLVLRKLQGGGGGCVQGNDEFPLLGWLVICFLYARRRKIWTGLFLRQLNKIKVLVLCFFIFSHCAKEHKKLSEYHDIPDPITDTETLVGEPCSQNLMVKITDNSHSFCIDRFEASLDAGAMGNNKQQADPAQLDVDGSTKAIAKQGLDETPTRDVSWYQAKSACQNAGKRLCSVTEWETACRGPNQTIYPYGQQFSELKCNGFYFYAENAPLKTGSLETCGNDFGVYDLSGNLEEWTESGASTVKGITNSTLRAIRGGSYLSNFRSLICNDPEVRASPETTAPDRGFRCCADNP